MIKYCAKCGNEFRKAPNLSKSQWDKRSFCSNSCASKGKNRTHGLSKHRLFSVWQCMKDRCYNERAVSYSDYGGRGIFVCDDWLSDFLSFYQWSISNGYEQGKQIDRIDNSAGYSPDNCRFVKSQTNNRNRRSNRIISYGGETAPLIYFAEKYGIKKTTLKERLNRGWSTEKAIETQVRGIKR